MQHLENEQQFANWRKLLRENSQKRFHRCWETWVTMMQLIGTLMGLLPENLRVYLPSIHKQTNALFCGIPPKSFVHQGHNALLIGITSNEEFSVGMRKELKLAERHWIEKRSCNHQQRIFWMSSFLARSPSSFNYCTYVEMFSFCSELCFRPFLSLLLYSLLLHDLSEGLLTPAWNLMDPSTHYRSGAALGCLTINGTQDLHYKPPWVMVVKMKHCGCTV